MPLPKLTRPTGWQQRTQLSKGGIKALEERFAEQEEKVKKAQQHVDELRVKLNISDAMASGDGPSPLMTADTLRKLEGLRIESKAEYVRQVTLLDRLKSLGQGPWPGRPRPSHPDRRRGHPAQFLARTTDHGGAKAGDLEKEYGPEHAEVIKCKAMADDLHSKIKSRVDGIMLGLDARVLSLSNSLDNLEKEVAQGHHQRRRASQPNPALFRSQARRWTNSNASARSWT